MRQARSAGLLLLVVVAILLGRAQARAADLSIDPIMQEMPQWCWAAASEMVLSHYGYPNLNPGGDYQCGVVAAQGGPCWDNCLRCLNGGGTTQRIAAVIRGYTQLAASLAGFRRAGFRPRTRGVMSPQEIIDAIDDDAPIVAGITPNGVPFPAGMGFSQHAVVIVGYEGDETALDVIINDPYPYPPHAVPYVRVGGEELQTGQYQLPYRTFVRVFHYGNSITFN